MLNELIDAKTSPTQMFPSRDPQKSATLMAAMDNINSRFGRGMIRPAVSGVERRWSAKAEFLSPRYTTRLEEILSVRA
jgi:DNA polymerase V